MQEFNLKDTLKKVSIQLWNLATLVCQTFSGHVWRHSIACVLGVGGSERMLSIIVVIRSSSPCCVSHIVKFQRYVVKLSEVSIPFLLYTLLFERKKNLCFCCRCCCLAFTSYPSQWKTLGGGVHNDMCIHSIPKPSLAMREGQLWGVRKTKDSCVFLLLFCLFVSPVP